MIMLSSQIAAHHELLYIWILVLIGITGTYLRNTLYFFLGRRKREVWLNKNEKLKSKKQFID